MIFLLTRPFALMVRSVSRRAQAITVHKAGDGPGATGLVPAGLLAEAKVVQTALLTAAMFALGVGVHFTTLRKVGVRPFVLATVSTVWVAVIALAGVVLIGS